MGAHVQLQTAADVRQDTLPLSAQVSIYCHVTEDEVYSKWRETKYLL